MPQHVVHVGAEGLSMRNAMSGVSAALPWSRSESVARRTLKISAAFFTLRPSASMIGSPDGAGS